MKNITDNFDISERSRMSLFVNNSGDFTSFKNGMGSIYEQLGCFIPEFVVFVEIYNLEGDLILNYPVEHCSEADLEAAMKRQVLLYSKLMENVGVSTVAVETSLIESAEWFALEHFKGPEFLIVEALERADKLVEPGNEQLSYLDLINESENQELGIETPLAPIQDPPRPALCENPAEFQTIAIPVVMRAKSTRITPVAEREDEVDASMKSATSSGKPALLIKPGDLADLPSKENYAATNSVKESSGTARRSTFLLREIIAAFYSLASWSVLIISIRSFIK